VAADPIDQDLFFYGQTQTPPLDPDELTTEESVEIAIAITPSITPRQGSTIDTTYTYTRVTDQQIYTYIDSESLPFDRYLPLTIQTVNAYEPGDSFTIEVTPTTSTGDPLRGSDVIINLLVLSSDSSTLHTRLLLQDDGQGVDTAESDGTYSGTLNTTGWNSGLRLIVHAARTGFFQETVPAAFGYELVSIPLTSIFADGFESGNTSKWSATVP
jgi:hypothetical protein